MAAGNSAPGDRDPWRKSVTERVWPVNAYGGFIP